MTDDDPKTRRPRPQPRMTPPTPEPGPRVFVGRDLRFGDDDITFEPVMVSLPAAFVKRSRPALPFERGLRAGIQDYWHTIVRTSAAYLMTAGAVITLATPEAPPFLPLWVGLLIGGGLAWEYGALGRRRLARELLALRDLHEDQRRVNDEAISALARLKRALDDAQTPPPPISEVGPPYVPPLLARPVTRPERRTGAVPRETTEDGPNAH